LRNIRFEGDSTVPKEELRAAFPIRDGEVFNVEPIRNGIEALTKLYASRGYIDFAAVPDSEIDDNLRPWVSLVFQLALQKQYRVGKVEIIALDPGLETRLRGLVPNGEIFDYDVFEKFFKENKSVLPPGLSLENDIHVLRHVRAGIVDLTFDFRSCP